MREGKKFPLFLFAPFGAVDMGEENEWGKPLPVKDILSRPDAKVYKTNKKIPFRGLKFGRGLYLQVFIFLLKYK